MTSSAPTSAGRRVVGVDRSLSARVALEHADRRAGEDGSLVAAYYFRDVELNPAHDPQRFTRAALLP